MIDVINQSNSQNHEIVPRPHKEWHRPKTPCLFVIIIWIISLSIKIMNHEIVSYVPLFNSFHPCLSISNSKKSETGRERNNRRAGNSHQVFNSSYSMFMTLSFASSPFSPRMDFLFASARTSSLLGTIMAPRRRWSYSENSGRNFVTSVALI